jgi:hypothetical protein
VPEVVAVRIGNFGKPTPQRTHGPNSIAGTTSRPIGRAAMPGIQRSARSA